MATNFACDLCGATKPTEDEFEYRVTRPAAMNRGDTASVVLLDSEDCMEKWAGEEKQRRADAQAKAEAAAKEAEAAREALAEAQAKAQAAADAAQGVAQPADAEPAPVDV